MSDKETTIQELKDALKKFRDEREWAQFHNPKDLAEAISVEASELLELFMWQTKEQIVKRMSEDKDFRQEVEDELADVINFCLNLSNASNIDLSEAVRRKVSKAAEKYPIDKAKGIATKYNKL